MKNLLPLLLLILMITSCEKERDESMLEIDLIEMELMSKNDQSELFNSNSSVQQPYDPPFSPHGPVPPPSGSDKTTPEGDAGRACLSLCDRMYRGVKKECEKNPDCDLTAVEENRMKCRRACYD